jgi:hypothetical protein
VLDDFCTGYSSLLYLGRLPFDAVRIDRMLMDGSGSDDAAGGGMLRAVTAMTHELGRKVIVQGVETDEDVSYLRSIDCEYGQGFYYGDPISERDVLQLLKLVRKSERRIEPRGLFRAATRKKRTGDGADAGPVAAEAAQVAEGAGAAPAAAAAAAAAGGGQRVPAGAPAIAVPGGQQGGPVPAAARTGPPEPVTEPLRRTGVPKANVRPRGPMPAAAAAPPPPPRPAPEPGFTPFGHAPMPPPMPSNGPSNGLSNGPVPPAGFTPQPPFVIPGAPVPFPAAEASPPPIYPVESLSPLPQPPPAADVVAPSPEPVATAPAAVEPLVQAPPPPPQPAAQPAPVKRTPQPVRPLPNYDKLPPNIAASLQRLAGVAPTKPDSDAAE